MAGFFIRTGETLAVGGKGVCGVVELDGEQLLHVVEGVKGRTVAVGDNADACRKLFCNG